MAGRQEIVIYGGGGSAREIAFLCEAAPNMYEVVAFVDDNPAAQNTYLNNIPVMRLDDAQARFPTARMVGGVGSPGLRQKLMQKAAAAGFDFASVIDPNIQLSDWLEIGPGAVICAGTILTWDIKLGAHVQLNVHCSVHHDAVLGDYTTLAPGARITGNVHTGQRVYLGTNAVIIQGTPDEPMVIANDTVIGASACVTKPITEPGLTWVGVPARPLRH
ncbi:MAG: acetyltransferase [Chloroflexi bacterium]|nr:acetyltransferase [Chloroflexota bacterium]